MESRGAAVPDDGVSEDRAISRTVLADQVRDRLLEAILAGHYPPNSRIVETRVARELGTSQAPVREALRGLEALGLVEISPFRGARVRHPSTSELLESYVVRSELESLGARLAVPQLTEADLAELIELGEQMQRAARTGDRHAVAIADASFHARLVHAARNSTLERVWRALEPFSRTYLTLVVPGADTQWTADIHLPILAALQRGVACGVDEPGVEAGVGDRDRVSITRARGSLHLLPELDQLGEVGLGELRDGQAGTQRLQLGPDDVGLEELARRGMANAGAPERRDLDEAQRLESAQGLAHGRLTGPELARDPRLDDPGVRRVVPCEDRLQEPVPDLVCKDGARDGSVFGDSVVGHCGSSRLHRVVPAMPARVPRSLARRDPPARPRRGRRRPPHPAAELLDGS